MVEAFLHPCVIVGCPCFPLTRIQTASPYSAHTSCTCNNGKALKKAVDSLVTVTLSSWHWDESSGWRSCLMALSENLQGIILINYDQPLISRATHSTFVLLLPWLSLEATHDIKYDKLMCWGSRINFQKDETGTATATPSPRYRRLIRQFFI